MAEAFERLLGAVPAAVGFAPGRVNLIGEHVDYHGGVVLPVPLAQGTRVAIAPLVGSTLRFISPVYGTAETRAGDAYAATGGFADYPLAVLAVLRERGVAVPGFALAVAGDLPCECDDRIQMTRWA